MNQALGQRAEDKALSYLKSQGLRLIERNYSCLLGEIDLIMHDKAYYVFVEVRARSSTSFGGGIESVTPAKQGRIIKTALYYLMQMKLHEKVPLRFDVLSLDARTDSITWLKDAFGADY